MCITFTIYHLHWHWQCSIPHLYSFSNAAYELEVGCWMWMWMQMWIWDFVWEFYVYWQRGHRSAEGVEKRTSLANPMTTQSVQRIASRNVHPHSFQTLSLFCTCTCTCVAVCVSIVCIMHNVLICKDGIRNSLYILYIPSCFLLSLILSFSFSFPFSFSFRFWAGISIHSRYSF